MATKKLNKLWAQLQSWMAFYNDPNLHENTKQTVQLKMEIIVYDIDQECKRAVKRRIMDLCTQIIEHRAKLQAAEKEFCLNYYSDLNWSVRQDLKFHPKVQEALKGEN